MTTLTELIPQYLEQKRKLSPKSRHTYDFVLHLFASKIQNKSVEELTHQDLSRFIAALAHEAYAETTISLSISAIYGFFKWAAFQKIWHGDLSDIQYVAQEGKPDIIAAIPDYDREIIAEIVKWATNFASYSDLVDKRDAFMILAASSTGARLGKELCELKRSQVNWDEGRAVVIGKGNKKGTLRFSEIALQAGLLYKEACWKMDTASRLPLSSLPLFSTHNGNTTKPLTYWGAYKSLKRRAVSLFGDRADTFHPHLFRHDFVTQILMATGNLKLAQELARHKSVQTTERYAHLTDRDQDQAHKAIFNNLTPIGLP